jgi:hypothetical protein
MWIFTKLNSASYFICFLFKWFICGAQFSLGNCTEVQFN